MRSVYIFILSVFVGLCFLCFQHTVTCVCSLTWPILIKSLLLTMLMITNFSSYYIHSFMTSTIHVKKDSVLCGSKKYPSRDPFAHLLKGSLQTFLNGKRENEPLFFAAPSLCSYLLLGLALSINYSRFCNIHFKCSILQPLPIRIGPCIQWVLICWIAWYTCIVANYNVSQRYY